MGDRELVSRGHRLAELALEEHREALFFGLAAAAFMALYLIRFGPIVPHNDPFWYAHSAERIVAGKGYTVDIVFPIAYDPAHSIHSQPEYIRPPLYSYLVAAAFVFLPNEIWVTAVLSAAAYVVLVPLVYVVARDWFDVSTARWAAALTMLSPYVYAWSVSALKDVFFVVLVVALFAMAASRRWAACGAVLSLAYLTRGSSLAFLPPLAIYAYERGETPDVGRLLGAFAAVSLPYWVRNTILTGNPLFSYQSQQFSRNGKVEPFNKMFNQVYSADPVEWMLAHPGLVLQKTSDTLRAIPEKVFFGEFGGAIFVFFAVVGVWFAIRRSDFDTDLFATMLISALGFLFLHSITHSEIRYYLWFAVLGFIFAAHGIAQITRAIDDRDVGMPDRQVVATALVLLILVPNAMTVVSYHPDPKPDAVHQQAAEIQELTEPGDVVVADNWMIVRWRSDRTTIAAPTTYHELVESDLPNGDYLYLEREQKHRHRHAYPDEELDEDYRVVREWENGAVLLERI